jgi:hypothetical protein
LICKTAFLPVEYMRSSTFALSEHGPFKKKIPVSAVLPGIHPAYRVDSGFAAGLPQQPDQKPVCEGTE